MLSSLISCPSPGSGYYNAISTYGMLEVESIGQRMADRRLVKTSSMPNKKQHVVDFLMTIPQQSKKIFRATVTAIRQSQAGCLVLTVVFDTACSAESTETAIGGRQCLFASVRATLLKFDGGRHPFHRDVFS